MFEHKDFQKAIFDNYQHELTQPLTQQSEAIPDGMNIEVNAD